MGVFERMLESLSTFIFQRMSEKIKPGAMKNIMDPIFAVSEKFAYEFSFLRERYLDMYHEMIDGELGLVSSLKDKRVLVIGSGSLPATAILFARRSEACVVGVDIDAKAVMWANKLVGRMGFDKNKLHFVVGDGLDVDLSGFDVVLLLYGIRQQKKMLKAAAKKLDDGACVIVRTTCHGDAVRIDSEYVDLSEWFVVDGHVHSNTLGPIDSFCLKKKP